MNKNCPTFPILSLTHLQLIPARPSERCFLCEVSERCSTWPTQEASCGVSFCSLPPLIPDLFHLCQFYLCTYNQAPAFGAAPSVYHLSDIRAWSDIYSYQTVKLNVSFGFSHCVCVCVSCTKPQLFFKNVRFLVKFKSWELLSSIEFSVVIKRSGDQTEQQLMLISDPCLWSIAINLLGLV